MGRAPAFLGQNDAELGVRHARGGERVEQAGVVGPERERVRPHAAALEEGQTAPICRDRLGRGRERVGEVVFDQAACDAEPARGGVDDDARQAAQVAVDAPRGASFVALEAARPRVAARSVERGHRDDEHAGERLGAPGMVRTARRTSTRVAGRPPR
ncbi:MAG: hypothetical protein R3B49_10565 [Phycisphaerales bacterium]